MIGNRRIIFSALLAGLFGFAGIAGEVSAKKMKVLMIGNSFSVCVLEEMPQVASAMGLELDIASLYIGGCSLETHWRNFCVAATNAAFRPYRFDRVIGTTRSPKTRANVPEMLVAEKWDVITLQQASHFSWRRESYQPYLRRLIREIRQLAPQAEIILQETWSYTPWDKRLATWKITPEDMYEALHAAYYAEAEAASLRVIPTGTAIQHYRQQLPVTYRPDSFGGDVCGSATFLSDGKGGFTPKGDVFHLNPAGQYLQALTWTAFLFDADVTRCKYTPHFLTPEQAKLMRKCVMESINR